MKYKLLLIIIALILSFDQILIEAKKKKNKKKKKQGYVDTQTGQVIYPNVGSHKKHSDIDDMDYCSTCMTIVDWATKNLKYSNTQMDVVDLMDNMCTQKKN